MLTALPYIVRVSSAAREHGHPPGHPGHPGNGRAPGSAGPARKGGPATAAAVRPGILQLGSGGPPTFIAPSWPPAAAIRIGRHGEITAHPSGGERQCQATFRQRRSGSRRWPAVFRRRPKRQSQRPGLRFARHQRGLTRFTYPVCPSPFVPQVRAARAERDVQVPAVAGSRADRSVDSMPGRPGCSIQCWPDLRSARNCAARPRAPLFEFPAPSNAAPGAQDLAYH